MNWKNILTRAGWAFLAAFGAAFVVPSVITDIDAWQSAAGAALVAAVAALISTIKTIIVELTTGTTSITVSKEL